MAEKRIMPNEVVAAFISVYVARPSGDNRK
jgi:hypothetical protein